VRRAVDERRSAASETTHCVANLSYVYDHHVRALAERLTAAQHEHHDLVIASTHVHLDHDSCLESVMLKGPTGAVRAWRTGSRRKRAYASAH
jgi:CopG family nickel-responsive transcriptional regulator